jgi:hypothetical protein
MLPWLNKKIASYKTRRWFLVLSTSIVLLAGLEAISFLTGIYQLGYYLNISIAVYLYLMIVTSLIFDLKLKIPLSWQRASYYYRHAKTSIAYRWFKKIKRALLLRFLYLWQWQNWRKFQNFLILPSLLFWAVAISIFLNPFREATKQIMVLSGTLLLSVEIWYLKFVFTKSNAASKVIRNLMGGSMVVSSFFTYSSLLGITWYLGLPDYFFVITSGCLAFLYLYQSFFREMLGDFRHLPMIFLGSVIIAAVSGFVIKYWTVNYYSAGLLVSAFVFIYWNLVSNFLWKKLSRQMALEYLLVFLLALIFALSTTNFHARIG